ncbi:hypothetical protein L917_10214 [Phytophthora nicotianae]|uniref:Uncharacterized protein n=1 Tax=Phytophthora nicotianae TaxID=4792 RepID=W2NXH7_PHYNI|nr:hypothetical protein L917_10214 [Phytophthora nicotianae]ETM52653.1 hypothetical protein L914_03774 [Phytophthora nicotianae]
MGNVQTFYPRLNLPLPYGPERRGLRLNNLFRMANYRVANRRHLADEAGTEYSGTGVLEVKQKPK